MISKEARHFGEAIAPALGLCPFCPHPQHFGEKCTACGCKGKRGFFKGIVQVISQVLGDWYTG
jgi:hypothetical protein